MAYKDRSAAFDQKYLPQIVKSGNGIFSPVIVYNGRVAGTWKRSLQKKEVVLSIGAFDRFNKTQTELLKKAVKQCGKFLGKEIGVNHASAGNVNLS